MCPHRPIQKENMQLPATPTSPLKIRADGRPKKKGKGGRIRKVKVGSRMTAFCFLYNIYIGMGGGKATSDGCEVIVSFDRHWKEDSVPLFRIKHKIHSGP